MISPLDLVGAAPWRRAVFTTYALSLSFFEAAVLDALVRGRSQEALILADILGVKSALSEQGAQLVGKQYDVEPIAIVGGVFHTKIAALLAENDCHLLLGSGNLTFNGWGGNLEVVEHLHPSFAADAIADVAGFFEALSSLPRARHGVASHCMQLASDLRQAVQGKPQNGNIRVLHSLNSAISEQMAEAAADMGGATRLMVASPFWDEGRAIDSLCSALGLAEVFVHAHDGGTVQGDAGANWPAHPTVHVHPVRLAPFADDERRRRLHAKAFEIVCRRGRIVFSGSPNASGAALGLNRNVETCVVRLQRNSTIGWEYEPASAPEWMASPASDEDDPSETLGILRATMVSDQINGRVLSPRMSGWATVFQLTGEGPKELGPVQLDTEGRFQISTPSIEMEAWQGGRLVIRVENTDGRRAEGFVSIAAFGEIKRRAGILAPRFLALLAGREVPADAAALMAFFTENPKHLELLGPRRQISSSKDDAVQSVELRMVAVDELIPEFSKGYVGSGGLASSEGSWRRFMEIVHSAFRERRGPFAGVGDRKGDDDDDEDDDSAQESRLDPAVPRLLENFRKLFDQLLSPKNAPRFALLALDIMLYVAVRASVDAEALRTWMNRLASVLGRSDFPSERRADVAAFYLYWLGLGEEHDRVRSARGHILRSGYAIDGGAPSFGSLSDLQGILPVASSDVELWARVQNVRTPPEYMRAYIKAISERGELSGEASNALKRMLSKEWSVLEAALINPSKRSRIQFISGPIDACPRHGFGLPLGEQHKLRSIGAATAVNCCGHILIDQEI